MKQFIAVVGVSLLTLLASLSASARPEYAIKHRLNRCTNCHVSPVGGELRHVLGKQYGTHTYKGGKWTTRDEFSMDMRSLFFQPEKPSSDNGGLSLMAISAGANVQISSDEESGPEIRAVYNHVVSGFLAGPRDTYLRMRFFEDDIARWAPQYLLVGQHHIPFGLLSDEHEVYTKIQSSSTWNNFEMGFLIAGNPFHSLHWDVSLANGERNGGGLGPGRALLWGTTFNLRYMPSFMPLMLGTSYSQHKKKDNAPSPEAFALYAMIPLSAPTFGLLEGTISFEYSEAQYWNESISKFVSDAGYEAAVKDETSAGFLAKIEYEITPRFMVSYQFESLALNKDYLDDAFIRHGYGLKYWAASNTYIITRFTQSYAQAPSETDSTEKSNVDGLFLVLQTSI